MEWDLSVLYSSQKAIDGEITDIGKLVEKAKQYRGKINGMGVKELVSLVTELETIHEKIGKLQQFPGLRLAADANDKEASKLYNTANQLATSWKKDLAFISLELGKWLNEKPGLIDAKSLASRKFYLERIKTEYTHKLSEIEEILILEKDRNGAQEWSRLQEDLIGKSKFKIMENGKEVSHSWNSGYGLITHSDHKVRKAALIGLGQGLEKKADIYAYAFRNLASNYISETKRRKYSNYLEPSLFTAHLNEEIVDSMFEVLIENRGIFQDFLNMKAALMGTKTLRGEDLEAPFPFSIERKVTWDEAKQIVVDGFTDFDSEFGEIAADMFANNRVDALLREGKGSGAFCASWYAGKSAFIKMGFSENLDSVATLAHEMGHAVHAYLNSANQPYVSTGIGMPIAETASEFGSLLFSLKFMNDAKTEEEKKSVLFNMVQNFMIVIFEVGSRKLFEDNVYQALDNGEFLEADKINELFWKARSDVFGKAIKWLPEQAYHWCWKPHYYDPSFRYYNYPYVFGEFSVLSLYAYYRKDEKTFTANFKEFLKAGASKHPQEMLKELFGFDLTSKEFWQAGIDELKNFVDQCKAYL